MAEETVEQKVARLTRDLAKANDRIASQSRIAETLRDQCGLFRGAAESSAAQVHAKVLEIESKDREIAELKKVEETLRKTLADVQRNFEVRTEELRKSKNTNSELSDNLAHANELLRSNAARSASGDAAEFLRLQNAERDLKAQLEAANAAKKKAEDNLVTSNRTADDETAKAADLEKELEAERNKPKVSSPSFFRRATSSAGASIATAAALFLLLFLCYQGVNHIFTSTPDNTELAAANDKCQDELSAAQASLKEKNLALQTQVRNASPSMLDKPKEEPKQVNAPAPAVNPELTCPFGTFSKKLNRCSVMTDE
jgi:hypothetical protein